MAANNKVESLWWGVQWRCTPPQGGWGRAQSPGWRCGLESRQKEPVGWGRAADGDAEDGAAGRQTPPALVRPCQVTQEQWEASGRVWVRKACCLTSVLKTWLLVVLEKR